jgi:hypothetical protein
MHLQKNVFESTMGFLGLTGKVKDGLKSRKDLVDLKIRQELHPQPRPNGKQYLLGKMVFGSILPRSAGLSVLAHARLRIYGGSFVLVI